MPELELTVCQSAPSSSIWRAGAWVAAAVIAARVAVAQEAPGRFAAEGRVDVVTAGATAVQGGMGVTTSLGTSLRLGGVAAVGAIVEGPTTDRSPVSARVDLFGRLLVDPFKELSWAPYVGGGGSVRSDYGRAPRGYLLALIGVEGPRVGDWIPAVELGLGGGTRIGVVLQRGGRDMP